MTLTIQLPKPRDIQALFSRATADADKHNITWRGDIHQGQGAGRGFEGSYTVDTESITIYVLKKPAWVTKARIEKAVRQYVLQEAGTV